MTLQDFLTNNTKKKTVLGIGPVSKNVVDATIDISNIYDFPILLIASRRQIECRSLGGGYVNNWDTETFSSYVLARNHKKNILLCRDHGGPWQGADELSLDENQAMETAKLSFSTDIENNFSVIHIDPSINSLGDNDPTTYSKVEELLIFCNQYSQKLNLSNLSYEVGNEEQNSVMHSPDELQSHLKKISNLCLSNKINMPIFQVVQTGTKVMEDKNIGLASKLNDNIEKNQWLRKITDLQNVCKEFGVHIKEHNTDYLRENLLSLRPVSGISAANVAPEFGVIETLELIKFFDENGLTKYKDKFLELSLKSNKWEKWMINKDFASDFHKAIISGHYVFASDDFKDIVNSAVSYLGKDLKFLNDRLKKIIINTIKKYILNFNLVS